MWSDSMHTLMWKLAFLLAFILTVCFGAQARHNPGTFTATGSLTTARGHDSATLLDNGLVLIAGGYCNSGDLSSAELYNPATGTFIPTGSLITARDSHTATLLNNGLVLLAGGEGTYDELSNAEVYNPATGTFIATGSMTTARYLATATLLNNGQVLITGGVGNYDGPDYLSSAELYNPATGTFTATGSLITARDSHTATLLNNGLVLITGGNGSDGDLTSTELYNPSTAAFTSTGSMITARYHYTATLLNSGEVLIAGGNNGSFLSSAELYEASYVAPQIASLSATSGAVGTPITMTGTR